MANRYNYTAKHGYRGHKRYDSENRFEDQNTLNLEKEFQQKTNISHHQTENSKEYKTTYRQPLQARNQNNFDPSRSWEKKAFHARQYNDSSQSQSFVNRSLDSQLIYQKNVYFNNKKIFFFENIDKEQQTYISSNPSINVEMETDSDLEADLGSIYEISDRLLQHHAEQTKVIALERQRDATAIWLSQQTPENRARYLQRTNSSH